MRIPRIYCEQELFRGEMVVLDQENSHHLQHVLRKEIDSEVEIFNHQAKCFKGKLIRFDKKNAQVEIISEIIKDTESSLSLTLGLCLIKPDKFDMAVQKAVELGVSKIVPVIAKRSSLHLDQKRMANKIRHWQAIAVSSTAQSHRVVIPTIQEEMKLTDFIGNITHGTSIFFHPDEESNLSNIKIDSNQATVLIGPEGGFTEEEVTLLKNNHWRAYNLGRRILRAETAAIAAVTILQNVTGNM